MRREEKTILLLSSYLQVIRKLFVNGFRFHEEDTKWVREVVKFVLYLLLPSEEIAGE